MSSIFRSRLSRLQSFYAICSRNFYDSRTKDDTIFAPATTVHPNKGSPLAVIRISGQKTESVLRLLTRCDIERANQLDSRSSGPNNIKPRIASLRKIYSPEPDHELIDVGLVLWFPKPNSYTSEDVCELHTHGSQAVVKSLLTHLGNLRGLRPAEPGEFTRRAVANNKMSLMQAEGLADLIASKTDNQRKLALSGLDGSIRHKYNHWIDDLIRVLAHLEASIDFGEDELLGEEEVVNNCVRDLKALTDDLKQFLKSQSTTRQYIKSGFHLAILGKPNVGKSTFMNLLSQTQRSIVSDMSGTTRDIIEHSFELNGHSLTICDTAGLKEIERLNVDQSNDLSNLTSLETSVIEQNNAIERVGIRKALVEATKADLILYLIDFGDLTSEQSMINTAKDIRAMLAVLHKNEPRTQTRILHLVVNKIDLHKINGCMENRVNMFENLLKETLPSHDCEFSSNLVSCKTGENFSKFIDKLTSRLDGLITGQNDTSEIGGEFSSQLHFVNERHLSLLRSTQRHLEIACTMNLKTIDEMAQHVRESVDYLSRIVGTVSNDQVIDVIFRDFCIGK